MQHASVPSSGYIRATRVTGTAVYNPEGEQLGSIEDVVLTKVGGEAVYAIMSFGGFLGIGERYHPLPWSMLHYDTGKGGYVVGLTREELEGGPTIAIDEEPDWEDPVFGTRITDHYGPPVVDPVEGERRI